MRRWAILGVLLVALVAIAVLAVSNLSSYLNRNRAWLAEQVGTALGRPVEFDEIGVSLRGGLGARVTNVRIGDDAVPGFYLLAPTLAPVRVLHRIDTDNDIVSYHLCRGVRARHELKGELDGGTTRRQLVSVDATAREKPAARSASKNVFRASEVFSIPIGFSLNAEEMSLPNGQ